MFRILPSDQVQFTFGPVPGLSTISTGMTVSLNTWYHLVAVRNVGADMHDHLHRRRTESQRNR